MKIALAQIRPEKGNIPANIARHKKLIARAVSIKASAIFFPELSLTSYEPALAKELATDEADPRLDDFRQICNMYDLTIGLGLPIKKDSDIRISMVIFQPGLPVRTYSKQQLHRDEWPYFMCGNEQILLEVAGKKIAPAICYESLQTDHADEAAKLGAEIYLASVAKSQNRFEKAAKHYAAIAKRHAVPALMSNCTGPCDNFESIGKSSVWNRKGKLIGQMDEKSEGILVFDTEKEEAIPEVPDRTKA